MPGTARGSRPMPAPTPVDGADWDLMFRAVMAKLRTTAGQPRDGLYLPADANISAPAAAILLDCVRALECLHAMQTQARGPQRGG